MKRRSIFPFSASPGGIWGVLIGDDRRSELMGPHQKGSLKGIPAAGEALLPFPLAIPFEPHLTHRPQAWRTAAPITSTEGEANVIHGGSDNPPHKRGLNYFSPSYFYFFSSHSRVNALQVVPRVKRISWLQWYCIRKKVCIYSATCPADISNLVIFFNHVSSVRFPPS